MRGSVSAAREVLDERAPVDVAAGRECVTRTRRSEICSVASRAARRRRLSIARRELVDGAPVEYVTASGTSTGAAARRRGRRRARAWRSAARRAATSASAVFKVHVMSAAWTVTCRSRPARRAISCRRAAASSTVSPPTSMPAAVTPAAIRSPGSGGGRRPGGRTAATPRSPAADGEQAAASSIDAECTRAPRRGYAGRAPRCSGSRAAVDRHVRAADDARAVLAQEAHDGGDLLRAPPSATWSASGIERRLAGVSMTLGRIALARIPSSRYSFASTSTNASTAALATM